MTPWTLFLYTIALTGGLTVAAIIGGVLRFAWIVVMGWVMGAPADNSASGVKGAGES